MDKMTNDQSLPKEKRQRHNVFLAKMGKVHAWDDDTKTESIDYDNKTLNNMEKAKRENEDKLKVVKEQFGNEMKAITIKNDNVRREAILNNLRNELHEKGMITNAEYEKAKKMLEDKKEDKENADAKTDSNQNTQIDTLQNLLDTTFKTDYLLDEEPIALKFGCISIFDPKRIGGLEQMIYKLRGMFQTQKAAEKRVKELIRLYPDDRTYIYQVGKWTPYSSQDLSKDATLEQIQEFNLNMLKKLNYCMKCYIDSLSVEKENFEKRKNEMISENKKKANDTKLQNRKERRLAAKKEKKAAAKEAKEGKTIKPAEQTSIIPQDTKSLFSAEEKGFTVEQQEGIDRIFNYLCCNDLPWDIYANERVDDAQAQRQEITLS